MGTSTPPRFTLNHDGHAFAVDTTSKGLHTVARLFVDEQQIDERKSMGETIVLEGGGLTAVVTLDWLGHVTEILAVPSGTDPKKASEDGVPFTPPAGSRAARLDELRRAHPVLYAARHVAKAVTQMAVGVLGVGALLWGLLPRINLPEVRWPELPTPPLPTIDLPAIPWPDVPLPAIDLPDIALPGWVGEIWAVAKWLLPIVIALVVAVDEVKKRRKREARRG